MVWGFLFLQAEDGIRDGHVTGVQTCALPIYSQRHGTRDDAALLPGGLPLLLGRAGQLRGPGRMHGLQIGARVRHRQRSEERRVGKAGRTRWWEAEEERQSKTRA